MKNMLIICIFLLGAAAMSAQQKNTAVYSIAFYNLENLFDTEDDPANEGDDEFLPKSAYNWTTDKYTKKLDNMALVISRLARERCPDGPAVIGVTELENRRVLEDLVRRPSIAAMGLKIVHQDSPDRRGIDVALLYNPKLFEVVNFSLHPYHFAKKPDYVSRDQLLVSGVLAGDTIHVSVNHWPSRYGSKSSELREAAAANIKPVLDSLYRVYRDPKVIIMGDLNDDPTNKSVRVILNAKKNPEEVKERGLYNPMWRLFDKGIGSLAYQGKWNLFDQIIVSKGLLGSDTSTGLRFWNVEIFNRNFLIQQEGPDKGYPFRTFSGNTFINGYSDHFPVILYVVK